MDLIHAGLGASSEDRADRFYVGVLGLEKSLPKTLERELGLALFGIDADLTMLNYKGQGVHFEIFVLPGPVTSRPEVAHTCLQVADLAALVGRCRQAGARVIEVPKGDKTLTFVADFDGNLFEMKGA